MDGFPEYKALQKRLDQVEREIVALRADISNLQNQERGFRTELDKLVTVIVGDHELDITGLLDRVRSVEERGAPRLMMLGLFVNSVVGLATLMAILFR